MTKQERIERIEEGLQKTNEAIASFESKKLVTMSADFSPLEMMKLAFVAKDTLEALRALEEPTYTSDDLSKFIKLILAYQGAKMLAIKTVGKKRIDRLLKIGGKYVDQKIDKLEKAVKKKG